MGKVVLAFDTSRVQSVCPYGGPEVKFCGLLKTAAVWIMRKPVNKAKNMDKSPARKGVDLFLGDRG